MNNSQILFKHKYFPFSILGTVFVALLAGYLLLSGFGVMTIGLCMFILLCLFLKKAENIFLMWLLISPLFTVGSVGFLKFGTDNPIITFNRVVIGMLLLFFLIQVVMKKRKLWSVNKLEIAMLIFSFIIIHSIIFKNDNLHGTKAFIDAFALPFIIYFLAKNLMYPEKYFSRFISILIAIAVFISIIGIFEHFTGEDIFPSSMGLVERTGWLRVNGPYKKDSTFGVNVAICFFIVLYRYIVHNKRNKGIISVRKIFYAAIACLLAIALFFTVYSVIWLSVIAG